MHRIALLRTFRPDLDKGRSRPALDELFAIDAQARERGLSQEDRKRHTEHRSLST